MKLFSLLLLCLSLCLNLPGQQTSDSSMDQKLDIYLRSANAVDKFNGTALVSKNGKILLEKGYGFRDISAGIHNDTNTIFQIGSITKSFTAMIVLKLQEEGTLSIQDPLSKYFPEFPKGNKITIQNLLTHTSGLHNYTDIIGEEDSAIVGYPVPQEKVLQTFEHNGFLFKPGSRFEYNNSGYYLLGMIIEKITGKPYETVVREMIFDPLGMSHSGFDYIHLKDPGKAQGYSVLSKDSIKKNHSVDSTVYYAAGGMYSSVTDLHRWLQVIMNHQILSDSSWQLAFTPFKNNYALGFFIDSLHGRMYIRHSGGLLGFTSDYLYFPKDSVTIILLNNVGNYDNSLFPVVTGIASIVFGLPYSNWKQTPALNIDESLLKSYTGTYEFNADHIMIVSFEKGGLFIVDTNPKDKLPKLPLYAESENMFYIKEAQLKFEFIRDAKNIPVKLVTYNTNGKDAEWKKVK